MGCGPGGGWEHHKSCGVSIILTLFGPLLVTEPFNGSCDICGYVLKRTCGMPYY